MAPRPPPRVRYAGLVHQSLSQLVAAQLNPSPGPVPEFSAAGVTCLCWIRCDLAPEGAPRCGWVVGCVGVFGWRVRFAGHAVVVRVFVWAYIVG